MLRLAALLGVPGVTKTGETPVASSLNAEKSFTGWEVAVREVRKSEAQNETTVGSYRGRS